MIYVYICFLEIKENYNYIKIWLFVYSIIILTIITWLNNDILFIFVFLTCAFIYKGTCKFEFLPMNSIVSQTQFEKWITLIFSTFHHNSKLRCQIQRTNIFRRMHAKTWNGNEKDELTPKLYPNHTDTDFKQGTHREYRFSQP